MIAQIYKLRSMIDVPLSEAKKLLTMCDGDVQSAYAMALDRKIAPIVAATGYEASAVIDVFLKNGQNSERTLEHLRYLSDPVAYAELGKPKVSELVEAIQRECDVYSILEACDAYGNIDMAELQGLPQVIQNLVSLGVFYSYYLTDTDALLRYHPAEHHAKIEYALRSIGHSPTAERYHKDVIEVDQSDENFAAFLAEEPAFTQSLQDYCLSHVEEIFAWQMEEYAKAEKACTGQSITPVNPKL